MMWGEGGVPWSSRWSREQTLFGVKCRQKYKLGGGCVCRRQWSSSKMVFQVKRKSCVYARGSGGHMYALYQFIERCHWWEGFTSTANGPKTILFSSPKHSSALRTRVDPPQLPSLSQSPLKNEGVPSPLRVGRCLLQYVSFWATDLTYLWIQLVCSKGYKIKVNTLPPRGFPFSNRPKLTKDRFLKCPEPPLVPVQPEEVSTQLIHTWHMWISKMPIYIVPIYLASALTALCFCRQPLLVGCTSLWPSLCS